ncbi:TlpA family protein disulfide reductase [Cetobacterium sp. SF1]|uniref:TlpA family protein disulfide reductase n=1 Tax=Cetobacterium sp. SF1 TaxID=3417654 RepID=UPI003CF976AF
MNFKNILFLFFLLMNFTQTFSYKIGDKISPEILSSLGVKKSKVYLNFSTTWCSLCIGEKIKLQQYYETNIKNSSQIDLLVIYGPHRGDTSQIVEEYISTNNYSFPFYYDRDKSLATKFKVKKVPTTFYIEKGILKNIHVREYPFENK